jgi:MacB-like periplasmic core domain
MSRHCVWRIVWVVRAITITARKRSQPEVEAFYGVGDNKLTGQGEPERLSGVPVSANFFQLLGVQPRLGRLFTAEECKWNGPNVVLLGYGLWVEGADAEQAKTAPAAPLDGLPGESDADLQGRLPLRPKRAPQGGSQA